MTDPDLIRLFIEPLERLGIPYMVTGGVASVVYGDPRFTRDIDLVPDLRESDIAGLTGAFAPDRFYVPPGEVPREAATRHGHFNIIHGETALRADVYVKGDDPLHAWAFERRSRLPVESLEIWLAPIEYVVIRKLECFAASGSDRHLRDVAMMLAVSGDSVDRPALGAWIDRLALAEQLARAERYSA